MKNISLKILIPSTIIMLIVGVLIGKVLFQGSSHEMEMDEQSPSMSEPSTASGPGSEEQIWTCSMHPQVRQNEPGICPICEMDLIPLDNQLSNDDPTVLQMTETSAKLAQISTYTVGASSSGSTAHEIAVDGTVELDERLKNSQTSHLGGRIEKLYVNFTGEYVSAGQKIATIYSPELLTASKELITAAKFDGQISGVKEASIRKLKNWKITDDQISEILSSGNEIETIDIYADHSGYVLKKMLSQGDYVRQGGVLYTLGQTNRVWLLFNVFESDLSSVRKGSLVKFQAPAIPNEEFQARITYIDPILNPSNRTAIVRAEASSYGNKLKPGMLLKGIIASASSKGPKDLISIPKSAVLWTGKRSVVYVQLTDMDIPSFQFREVTLGATTGDQYLIEDGLEIGEVVVTNGAFVIDAAAQLNNQQSMMNKDVTIKQEGMDGHPNFKAATPDEFRMQLESVVDLYLEIKDGLVDTDAEISKALSARLLEALSLVDMTLLKGDAHMYWMEQEQIIRTHSEKMGNSDDIEEQRRQFDFLSQGVINVVKAFGVAKESLYVQFCPMAFNSKGAEWISTENTIRNPYFGDKMMKCGSVLDSVTVAMNAWEEVMTKSPQAGHRH